MKNINKNTILIIAIVLIVVALGGGFFAGMQYQKTQRGTFAAAFGNGNSTGARGFGGGNFQGSRPITGQIVSVSDNTMTVKLSDGSTKIVILSTSTSINKADKGSISDLKVGDTVATFGSANSDGSITAQNVQLNPMIRMGGAPR